MIRKVDTADILVPPVLVLFYSELKTMSSPNLSVLLAPFRCYHNQLFDDISTFTFLSRRDIEMPSARIEFLKVTQNEKSYTGPDNVISSVLKSQDVTTSSTAVDSDTAPAGTDTVRVTAIAGGIYANTRETATAVKSVRVAQDHTEYFSMSAGRKVSVMTATS